MLLSSWIQLCKFTHPFEDGPLEKAFPNWPSLGVCEMPSREGRLSKAQVLQPGTEELTLGEGVSYMSSFRAAGEAGAPPEKWEKVPTAGNVHAVPGQASESGIIGCGQTVVENGRR